MVEPPKPKTSWSFTHIIDFLRPKEDEAHTAGHRTIAVKCDLCFDIEVAQPVYVIAQLVPLYGSNQSF